MNKYLSIVTVCFLSILFSGCASTKEDVFDQSEMKTMKQIYNEHFGRQADVDSYTEVQREKSNGENTADQDKNEPDPSFYVNDVTSYTRDSSNELSVRFPELNNPMLIMFVFPHITESNLPVPGYSTAFRMFEKTPFAMPGESVE